MSAAGPNQLLSLQQAVDEGYAAYSTLRKYISQGTLAATKVGTRLKVRREDLDALRMPARASTFADVETAVKRVVATAPPLTDEQTRQLASLFGGGR